MTFHGLQLYSPPADPRDPSSAAPFRPTTLTAVNVKRIQTPFLLWQDKGENLCHMPGGGPASIWVRWGDSEATTVDPSLSHHQHMHDHTHTHTQSVNSSGGGNGTYPSLSAALSDLQGKKY